MSSEKKKLEFEARLSTADAVDYFTALIHGLNAGHLTFQRADKTVRMQVAESLDAEVKVKQKGDDNQVSFELRWTTPPTKGEARPPLAIRDVPGRAVVAAETRTTVPEAPLPADRALDRRSVREWLSECSVEELYEKAQSLELPGRSQMNKAELVNSLAQHPADVLFTHEEVYERAKAADIAGRSTMSKEELLNAM